MKTLSENAKLYGKAFENGYACIIGTLIDDEITESDESIIEQYTVQLDNAYASFTDALYIEVKDIKDIDEQNAVFYELRRELPSLVFENEFAESELKESLIKKWADDRPGGLSLIRLIKTFCKSMEWYDAESDYKLTRFRETYNSPAPQETPKSPIGRVETAYLFFKLKQRNIIKQSITDIELSKIVCHLTDYDAEKLRQKGKLTQKAKES